MPYEDAKYPHDMRLIAAAPHLLRVCKEANAFLWRCTTDEFATGGDRGTRYALQDAIEKAEGKPA